MKIAILGSCTTRDMVQFLPKEIRLELYVARSSLISLAAEAVQVNEGQILGEHSFNRRVVLWDMTKIFWDKLEEIRPDVLFIDFIDERFDLWQKGEQIVTRSNYLALSGVEEELLGTFELMRRQDESTHELWKRSCELVVSRLKPLCKTIVIHRSLWAEKYYVNGEVKLFDDIDRHEAVTANRWLNSYYDHFKSLCPDAIEIMVDEDLCVSNFAHKWGRDFFHYGDAYYQRLAEMVESLLESPLITQGKLKNMNLPKIGLEAAVERYAEIRSLDRWPSAKFSWASLDEFVGATKIESGLHSILIGSLVLDVYVDIVLRSPAYVYLHGNCPRSPNFKLPVLSGSNVLGELRLTKIVPSDPVLLTDESIELSWHMGNLDCNLQTAYRALVSKVTSIAESPEIVFWGGSGGGFAALYYSHFFPGSTAIVWNPQTNVLKYLPGPVNKYLKVAFGTSLSNESPVPPEFVYNVSKIYSEGYENRVIYIQNDEDWHVDKHLSPFLHSLGVDFSAFSERSYNGLVAPNIYLFLGKFSKDHDPPSNVEIHCALQECLSVNGDPTRFDFGRLIQKRHGVDAPPLWLIDGVLSSKIEFFRSDWPHHTSFPVINTEFPYTIMLSTGLSIDAGPQGNVDWNVEFDRDASTNIHELNSLTHVGRLLSAYEETGNRNILDAALAIATNFLCFIKSPDSLSLIMTNRGYSSSDHSTSIRANVFIKLIQVIGADDKLLVAKKEVIKNAIGHLWDIGDYLADPKNVYPSNHGIMSCLTLVQVANQFRSLRYISEHYLRKANGALLSLIKSSFDRDGWTNENTVGYHSFILRLLKEYVEYSIRNSIETEEIKKIEEYLSRGEQALAYCVRQDGSIPPIGDSPLYRPGISSINHSKFFRESGFLIVKDSSLYLSLVCGSRSDNHKQVDDSSITLCYEGEDLIIDGGSYCYDSNDSYRKYLVSFRGHSGLFSESVENLSPKQYLYIRKYAAIEEYSESSEGRFATAKYKLNQGNIECERRLLADYSGGVVIVDRASTSNIVGKFSQSFLLGPQMKLLEQTERSVVFEGDRFWLVITQFKPTKPVIEKGLSEPVVAGWCSINWREKESTYQVRFLQEGLEAHYLTRLQVVRKGDLNSRLAAYEFPIAQTIARLYA